MAKTFAELIEEIRQRTVEEKEELLRIVQQDLDEARRTTSAEQAQAALEAEKLRNVKFSSNAEDLRRMMKKRD